jgi:hypothetical protein
LSEYYADNKKPAREGGSWVGKSKRVGLVVIPLLTEVTIEILYLGLTTATFTGLFIATLSTDVFDYALAVDFFLKAAESLIDGLAFTNLDFYRHD